LDKKSNNRVRLAIIRNVAPTPSCFGLRHSGGAYAKFVSL